jgi:hypothetical protein
MGWIGGCCSGGGIFLPGSMSYCWLCMSGAANPESVSADPGALFSFCLLCLGCCVSVVVYVGSVLLFVWFCSLWFGTFCLYLLLYLVSNKSLPYSKKLHFQFCWLFKHVNFVTQPYSVVARSEQICLSVSKVM